MGVAALNKLYCVYRHLFPNGKSYIGITSQPPRRRWGNGTGYKNQPKIAAAIDKYGWNSVRHEVLAYCFTLEEANRLEQVYIREFDSVSNGYNITAGGDGLTGTFRSEETKAKISRANTGKPYTHGTKVLLRYVREHGAWNKGKHLSGEHLRKISEERKSRCSKKIFACDPISHEVVMEFASCVLAASVMGVSKEAISRCAKGKRKTSAGYEWRYANEGI